MRKRVLHIPHMHCYKVGMGIDDEIKRLVCELKHQLSNEDQLSTLENKRY